MNTWVSIYLLVYGSITFLFILIGFLLSIWKENKTVRGNIDLTQVSVLIPYRNEEKRIAGIISSIAHSKKLPAEILFIDDHSTDNTGAILKREFSGKNIQIIDLPIGREGKKEALRYGVEQSESKFILTMDADVSFDADYFTHVEQLGNADMHVLPAILKARKGIEYLFELDTILANALNVGVSGWKRPLFASGANLLYARSSYLEVDNYQSHKHMSSGDDTYVLRDFRRSNKSVMVHSGITHAVSTETPHSLKEFFDQRVRWAGKTKDMKDALANSLAVVQFLLSACFVLLFVITLINQYWYAATSLYLLKLAMDMLFFAPYFLRIRRFFTLAFLPLYELIFPIYFLFMLVLIGFYSPKWKGREVRTAIEPR